MFGGSDSIDLTAFGEDLQTSVVVMILVGNANGDVVVKLIGLGDQGNIDDHSVDRIGYVYRHVMR